MTLTVVPEGLGLVTLPLKGKISFLRKVVGSPWKRVMPAKEVVFIKVV